MKIEAASCRECGKKFKYRYNRGARKQLCGANCQRAAHAKVAMASLNRKILRELELEEEEEKSVIMVSGL